MRHAVAVKQFQVPLRMMNFYPPLLGARIRVKDVSPARDRLVVEMKLTWWNANFARTHFGGSLYMMIDPFYALMLKQQLGPATPCGTAKRRSTSAPQDAQRSRQSSNSPRRRSLDTVPSSIRMVGST